MTLGSNIKYEYTVSQLPTNLNSYHWSMLVS